MGQLRLHAAAAVVEATKRRASEANTKSKAADGKATEAKAAEVALAKKLYGSEAAAATAKLRRSVIVFVLGGPGSGKGTQCERIVRDFGFKHLSAGDLLRAEVASGSPTGKNCEALMKEGKLVPVEITLELLKNAMTRSSSSQFLIDGFPRALDQAEAFEKQVAMCSYVIYFDCPLETMQARLLKRGETSGRSDDNAETIKKRFDTFTNQSLPVITHYEKQGKAHKFSSVPAPDEVYIKVSELIKLENDLRADARKEEGGTAPAEAAAEAYAAAKAAAKAALSVADFAIAEHKQAEASLKHVEDKAARKTAYRPGVSEAEKAALEQLRSSATVVFVLGGPGSGKGTQCERIIKEHGYKHFSTGDLLRDEVKSGSPIGKQCEALMKEGKLVPMDVTISLLRNAMLKSAGSKKFLIDGFPRALDQAVAFEDSIMPCSYILYFDCPLETMETRLLKRGETSGRSDDNAEAIKKRFDTFTNQSLPVVTHYQPTGKVYTMSSVPPPDEVYEEVKKALVSGGAAVAAAAKERDLALQLATAEAHTEVLKKTVEVLKEKVALLEMKKGAKVLFVLGGPGSGKGTQCERIVKDFGYQHFSTGDLLRAEVASGSKLGRKCEQLMKDGLLVPMETTITLLKNVMLKATNKKFLIDGFPRALDQAVEFETSIIPASSVLYFDCPLATMEARLLKRGETSGRADDNLDAIKKRFDTFKGQSMPVVVRGECADIHSFRGGPSTKTFTLAVCIYSISHQFPCFLTVDSSLSFLFFFFFPHLQDFYKKQGKVIHVSSVPGPDEVYEEVKKSLTQF